MSAASHQTDQPWWDEPDEVPRPARHRGADRIGRRLARIAMIE